GGGWGGGGGGRRACFEKKRGAGFSQRTSTGSAPVPPLRVRCGIHASSGLAQHFIVPHRQPLQLQRTGGATAAPFFESFRADSQLCFCQRDYLGSSGGRVVRFCEQRVGSIERVRAWRSRAFR